MISLPIVFVRDLHSRISLPGLPYCVIVRLKEKSSSLWLRHLGQLCKPNHGLSPFPPFRLRLLFYVRTTPSWVYVCDRTKPRRHGVLTVSPPRARFPLILVGTGRELCTVTDTVSRLMTEIYPDWNSPSFLLFRGPSRVANGYSSAAGYQSPSI